MSLLQTFPKLAQIEVESRKINVTANTAMLSRVTSQHIPPLLSRFILSGNPYASRLGEISVGQPAQGGSILLLASFAAVKELHIVHIYMSRRVIIPDGIKTLFPNLHTLKFQRVITLTGLLDTLCKVVTAGGLPDLRTLEAGYVRRGDESLLWKFLDVLADRLQHFSIEWDIRNMMSGPRPLSELSEWSLLDEFLDPPPSRDAVNQTYFFF